MEKWKMERYNKGQTVYGKQIKEVLNSYVYFNHGYTLLYDFFFNPEYGFAKAFWPGKVCSVCGNSLEKDDWEYLSSLETSCWYHKRDWTNFELISAEYYHLQQMSIVLDINKYLDQFKE